MWWALAVPLALGLWVLAFSVGRQAGRNSVAWQIEHNREYRRHLLEELAQREGARLEMRG